MSATRTNTTVTTQWTHQPTAGELRDALGHYPSDAQVSLRYVGDQREGDRWTLEARSTR